MPRQKIKLGGPTKTAAALRRAELEPLLRGELAGLTDAEVAAALNARNIPAIGGGAWRRDGFQITRLRAQLGLSRLRSEIESNYREIREELAGDFGAATSIDNLLIEHVSWIAVAVHRFNAWIERNDCSKLAGADLATFRRLRLQLGAVLGAMRIASDRFEAKGPSIATCIYEAALQEHGSKVGAAVALRAVDEIAPKIAAPIEPAPPAMSKVNP